MKFNQKQIEENVKITKKIICQNKLILYKALTLQHKNRYCCSKGKIFKHFEIVYIFSFSYLFFYR